jgi:hypothetical protein
LLPTRAGSLISALRDNVMHVSKTQSKPLFIRER